MNKYMIIYLFVKRLRVDISITVMGDDSDILHIMVEEHQR